LTNKFLFDEKKPLFWGFFSFWLAFLRVKLYTENILRTGLKRGIVNKAIPLNNERSPGTSTHSLRSIGV